MPDLVWLLTRQIQSQNGKIFPVAFSLYIKRVEAQSSISINLIKLKKSLVHPFRSQALNDPAQPESPLKIFFKDLNERSLKSLNCSYDSVLAFGPDFW